ncbi:hypothetical protein J9303_02585 [Bacillaceae bacterium Marseille-Q3522]|nr:hypothetical protein [Bacillaceae bacterium Marseille-Q3522]
MKRQFWHIYFKLTIDTIFLTLVFFLEYIWKAMPIPVLTLCAFFLGSSLFSLLLLLKFPKKGIILYFLVCTPLLLLIGNVLHFPFLMVIFVGIYIFWRANMHIHHPDKQTEAPMMLFSLVWTIFLLLIAMNDKQYAPIIIAMMLVQVFFTLIGRFLKRWSSLDTSKNEKRTFFVHFASMIAIISVCAVLLAFIWPLVQKLFVVALSGVMRILLFFGYPLSFLAELEFSEVNMPSPEEEGFYGEQGLDTEIPKSAASANNFMIFTLIISALVAAFLLLYFYKKRRHKKTEEQLQEKSYSIDTGFGKEPDKISYRRKIKAPGNRIRKEIFLLEKYAKKHRKGRRPFETVVDWLRRIGINKYELMNQIYENARYGNKPISEEEEHHYKMEIKRIKHIIKETR